MRLRTAPLILAVAVSSALLVGCSIASTEPTDFVDESPIDDAESGVADEEVVATPPTLLTWESACMLSIEEVSTSMQAYDWQAASTQGPYYEDPLNNECGYFSSDPNSELHVGIDFRQYEPNTTYGWLSPEVQTITSFTAPSQEEGAINACTTATASPGVAGDLGICTTAGDVPVVVSANGTNVVVFPAGEYFFHVTVYGTSAAAAQIEPLLALASLLATRAPLIE